MSKPMPVFRPISAPLDVSDEDLNALGDSLGVPTMKKPEPPPAPKLSSKAAVTGPEGAVPSHAANSEATLHEFHPY